MRYHLPWQHLWGLGGVELRGSVGAVPAGQIEGRAPRGLCLLPGFVSASEREDIAAWIETHVRWSCGTSQGNRLETWVERQRPLPEWSRALGARMIEQGIFDEPPDYLHLIHYEAGRGIALHKDHEFLGTAVAGLTLKSSRVFEFKRGGRPPVRVLLLPGDLYIIAGEARYRWEHGVPRTRVDRFRGRDYERTDGLSLSWRRVIPNGPVGRIEPPDRRKK